MHFPLPVVSPSDAHFDVVTFGLNSIDLLVRVSEFPQSNSKHRLQAFATLPGGQAATAAVACARLGWRASYIGRFGGDAYGRLSQESLHREGVDTSGCLCVDEATNQFAVILVEQKTGDRTVLWDRDMRLRMAPEDVPAAVIESGRVLLVDCHETEAAVQAAQSARRRGIPTVIDVENVRPNIDQLLQHIDLIVAAREFPMALTGKSGVGEALRALDEEYRPALACVTLGAEGSLARCGGREVRTPAFPVSVVDTTGAGDAFRGGLIAGWLARWPHPTVEEMLRYANVVAGLNCRALGARQGIPTRREAEEWLNSH